MTPQQLLSELQSRGIEVVVVGTALRYRPVAAVTPELKAAMQENKPDLLRILAAGEAAEDGDTPFALTPAEIAERAALWLLMGQPRTWPICPR